MSDLRWLTARPIAHRGLHDIEVQIGELRPGVEGAVQDVERLATVAAPQRSEVRVGGGVHARGSERWLASMMSRMARDSSGA